ncbi:GTP cyclohydrolase 1 type 2 [invertebrate metagenome]|uniref:GTP cyclohydrolase 1 type 2 n=1 Tax=invertebrate metagenome TaxID=1711999 RepID=A0A2H9T9L7_9ZZZZ
MFSLCFFVPSSHLESVKSAVFSTGAGHYGPYDQCCWQTLGQGQFRALDGSSPYIGSTGETAHVDEYRVEMICPDDRLDAAVRALKDSHPYEQPYYIVWPVNRFPEPED